MESHYSFDLYIFNGEGLRIYFHMFDGIRIKGHIKKLEK